MKNLTIDQLNERIEACVGHLEKYNKSPDQFKSAIDRTAKDMEACVDELQARMKQGAGRVVGEGNSPPVRKVESGYQSVFEGARIEGSDRRVHVYRGDEAMGESSHDMDDMPDIGDIVTAMAGGPASSGVFEALNTGSDAAGGVMLSPEISSRFLDNIRPRSVAFRAGVGSIPMTSPWMRVITQTGDPTAAWRGEGEAVDPSAPSFSKYEVRPFFLGCITSFTEEMMDGASNFRRVVESAIASSMAVAVDEAILTGSGAANMPTGIRNWPGVLAHSMAGAPAYSMVSGAVLKILEEDFSGDVSELGWIRNPRDAHAFNDLTDTTGQPLMPNPWAAAVKQYDSTVMPINLGVSTTDGSHITGHFPSAVVFVHRGWKPEFLKEGTVVNKLLAAQDYLASEWKYAIRASIRMDVVVERPKWFAVANDMAAPA